MMHNAACIAAMAFSNAAVGVNHALAHAFGARFGVAHGRANALMLPHVIAYNAAVPSKFMPSPNQKGYVAHKKYAMMADLLGLGGETVEEKVQNLVAAIERLLDQLAFPRSGWAGDRIPRPALWTPAVCGGQRFRRLPCLAAR